MSVDASPSEFMAQPEAMRASVGNVGGILMQAIGSMLELEQLVVAPASFATIGGAVSAANTTMQAHQVSALRSLLTLFQDVNKLVRVAADAYELADQAAATSYGGEGAASSTPATMSLWSNPASSQLAAQATEDTGATPTPHSASTVAGYMMSAGLGQLAAHGTGGMPTDSAVDLSAWLGASPANQAWAGVVGVYSGSARSLADVPGGVQPGDVVIVDPGAAAVDQQPTIGVIGAGDQLYNHGLLSPDFGGTASVEVFRPLPTAAASA